MHRDSQLTRKIPIGAKEPTPAQTKKIQEAIQAFDNKQLDKSEKLFSEGIETW